MRPLKQRLRDAAHFIFPAFAFLCYGLLGKRMTVVGITGTDGKSTSVILTARMLRAAGHQVAHYSSVSIHDGLSEWPNDSKITTPGRMRLHQFLAQALRNGATHAVVEITSQGILQHRHRCIGFSLIGITNITPEHIEAHGSFNNYRDAKASLMRQLLPSSRRAVLPQELAGLAPKGIAVTIYGRESAEVSTTVEKSSLKGTVLTITVYGEEESVSSPLGGPFTPENILFSATVASAFGVSAPEMRSALESQGPIPGRCETLASEPLVIVDYAHTLAALSTLLPYIRRLTEGRFIHVFGAAGGGRDRYKRPLLAQLSERYADISIVTEENPFDEPEEDIQSEIRAGFSDSHIVHVVGRRELAVDLAQRLARPGDVVLLSGKGSESVIAGPKRSRRPYTEATHARCLFEIPSSA